MRSRRSGRGMARLGGMLGGTLDALGVRSRVAEQQVIARWGQTVGAHIAAASAAETVREGVLFVSCKSSSWANELTMHKDSIVKRLNAAVGQPVIRDIRFSSRGSARGRAAARKEDQPGPAKRLEAVELDASEIEAAARIASASASEELAARIERAVLAGKRLARLKREDVPRSPGTA